MQTLRNEALHAISKLPETATIDDMMYRLYVIDKVRKGQEAVEKGDVVSSEELLKEIDSW
ncbi:MAG: hypothetical protein KAW12_28295 [Candidatus Aminicenantes bacterium]|nr:hypothetical protein [Candidatus Aminicenantes bacterium]